MPAFYEAEHYPMDPPDPIEAIKFRMEQQGLTRRDLEEIIRTRTRIGAAALPLVGRSAAAQATARDVIATIGRVVKPSSVEGIFSGLAGSNAPA
jgi:hypothetical protein